MNTNLSNPHNSFTFLPYMCARQKHELEQLLAAADEIGAAATSVASQGGHGYAALCESREKFKTLLMSMAEHYRICIVEDTFTKELPETFGRDLQFPQY